MISCHSTFAAAPPCSSLQQLVIDPPRVCRWEEKQCCIKAASVQAFRHLSALTALHLPNCNLQGLPSGPYLSGLKRLVRWKIERAVWFV